MVIQNSIEKKDISVLKQVLACWFMLLLCAITTFEGFMHFYLLLSIMFVLYSSREEGAMLLFSLISYSRIVSLAPNYGISLGWIPLVVYIIKTIIMPFKIDKRTLVSFVVFVLYMCIGLDPNKSGFLSDVKTIAIYTFLFVLVFLNYEDIYLKLFDFYIIGHFLGVILSFPVNLSPRFSSLLTIAYTDTSSFNTLRFWGIDFDTNFFSENCAFIVACLLFFLTNADLFNINKKRSFMFLMIYLVLGVATFSKTFFVCLILIVGYFFCSDLPRKIGLLVATIIISIGLFYILNEATGGMLYATIVGRFVEKGNSIDSITTGRAHIWMSYINDWVSSYKKILFGVGMANKKLLSLNKMHHQTYIEILYQFGIVGSCIFLYYLYSIYNGLKKKLPIIIEKVRSRYLGIACIMIFGLTLGQFAFDSIIPQIVLSFIMLSRTNMKIVNYTNI